MRLTVWMLAALLAAGPVTAQVLAGAAQSESQQAGEWQGCAKTQPVSRRTVPEP
jgi:hypothetical protein